MKIGLVLPSVPSYSETFFRNKIIGLQQHGVEVVLFINNPRETFSSCKVYNAPELNGTTLLRYWNSLKAFFKSVILYPKRSLKFYQLEKEDNRPFNQIIKNLIANQFIMSKELDWLHFGFGTMALGRENIATVMGAKMAVSFRGFDYYVYPNKNVDCYQVLYSKKTKYHVLSEGMKKGLIMNGILEHQVVKITPAIDNETFNASPNKSEQKTLQITTVARLHWIKGLEYTLEALAILKAENFPFHYTIIGDGGEKERLQFTVYQLGLSDCVTFTGKLPPEEVKSQLQHTDIYIQYSIQEGFCNAVLEAQAMGLLCIVSDAEGLSENILDTKTGWVVPKRQPKLLAQKIREVCQLGVPEKERIRQAALKRVQEDFNLEKQQQAFLAFYEIK